MSRLLVGAGFCPGVVVIDDGPLLLVPNAALPNEVAPWWLALGEASDWIFGFRGNSFGAICDTFFTWEAYCW